MFNINFYVKRKEGASLSEFVDFWNGRHAELLKGFAEDIGVRALIKHEILHDHPVGIDSAKAYGTGPIRYDAVDTWKFNDIEVLKSSGALESVQVGLQKLAEAEDSFDIALSTLTCLKEKEHLKFGDLVIVTQGDIMDVAGSTNCMRILPVT